MIENVVISLASGDAARGYVHPVEMAAPSWALLKHVEVQNGPVTYSAWVQCSNGHLGSLHPNHEIDEAGKVTPSIGCTAYFYGGGGKDPKGCDYHVFAVLEQWAEVVEHERAA